MTSSPIRHGVAILAPAALLATLAASTAAVASGPSSCRAPQRHPFPSVSGLTASHTTCAKAGAVVEHIQGVWQTSNGTFPGWFQTSRRGPWWHCRYQLHGTGGHRFHNASCTSGRAAVKMRLNA